MDNKEKQMRFRESCRKIGDKRLQTIVSVKTWESLETIQKELEWTKREIVETAIAQMAERLLLSAPV